VVTLPAIIDGNDPVVMHGLSCRVKYVRLVRRKVAGKNPFFVQLVLEGEPYRKHNPDGSPKHPLGKGTVGLDAGPSTLAAAGKDGAIVEPFCVELVSKHQGIRLLQRKLDRQRRANNPDNYNSDGIVRKGPKTWKASKGMNMTPAHSPSQAQPGGGQAGGGLRGCLPGLFAGSLRLHVAPHGIQRGVPNATRVIRTVPKVWFPVEISKMVREPVSHTAG
jgi:hypothetical protein